jgi:tRNA (cytidine/uridine-2'-O-)-methyltransferase
VFAFAKTGDAAFGTVEYRPGDTLMFGRESVGLDRTVLAADWITGVVHIPMRPGVRSLNLSNSAAVAVYEAWRQCGYEGADPR